MGYRRLEVQTKAAARLGKTFQNLNKICKGFVKNSEECSRYDCRFKSIAFIGRIRPDFRLTRMFFAASQAVWNENGFKRIP